MRIPIKTEGLLFLAMGVEPVTVRETGAAKVDRDTGEALWRVHVTVMRPSEPKPELWSVTVPGEPKGLAAGQPVEVLGLEASTWEMNGKHGVSFRASSLRPVSAGANSKAAA